MCGRQKMHSIPCVVWLTVHTARHSLFLAAHCRKPCPPAVRLLQGPAGAAPPAGCAHGEAAPPGVPSHAAHAVRRAGAVTLATAAAVEALAGAAARCTWLAGSCCFWSPCSGGAGPQVQPQRQQLSVAWLLARRAHWGKVPNLYILLLLWLFLLLVYVDDVCSRVPQALVPSWNVRPCGWLWRLAHGVLHGCAWLARRWVGCLCGRQLRSRLFVCSSRVCPPARAEASLVPGGLTRSLIQQTHCLAETVQGRTLLLHDMHCNTKSFRHRPRHLCSAWHAHRRPQVYAGSCCDDQCESRCTVSGDAGAINSAPS